ncbi:hypothetical protein ACOWM4_02275 [Helicobacter pylori]
MWNEKFLKVIPEVVLLLCVLEIFEMFLIVDDMNKAEKLEAKIANNLKVLEDVTILLNEYLEGKQLEYSKKIK